jgi:hypothetical protein
MTRAADNICSVNIGRHPGTLTLGGMREMAHLKPNHRSAVDHAALTALVQRIKDRQKRQVELWRQSLQPHIAVAGASAAGERKS